MTTATIEPITLDKLKAFKRRRRLLLLLRGLCAGMVTLLVSMTFVAVVDLLIPLGDTVRTGMSVGAYGLTLAAIWFTSLRMLVHRENPRELARLVEAAEPGLREDLISAVELGMADDRAAYDSPAFRGLLQRDVANRMRYVQVGALLPPSLVFTWVLSASIAILTCLTLLMLPDTPFRHMLARALVPTANLERVTAIRITLLEPGPDDRLVAEGDTVDIRVQLHGPEPRRGVKLHTRTADGAAEQTFMEALDDRQYLSRIRIDDQRISFRITAGDAVTRRYQLEPVPRPRPVAFIKTFDYPAYTRLEDETVTESHGNIEALSGTHVTLIIQADQPLDSAHIRWQRGDGEHVERLRPHGEDAAMVRFQVQDGDDGARERYKVDLTARETGFGNLYSPEYQVRAIPDLRPSIRLDKPEGNVTAPPDAVIEFAGEAEDDIGLSRLLMLVERDGRASEHVLATDPPTPHAFKHHLDLFELGLRPGDRLNVRFAALDLRESRSESTEVTVHVASPGFDPERLIPVQTRARALEQVAALQRGAAVLTQRLKDHVEGADKDDAARRRHAIHEAVAMLDELQSLAEKADRATLRALAAAAPGRDAADLLRIARRLAVIERLHLDPARAALDAAVRADAAQAAALMHRAVELAAPTPQIARQATDALRPIHAAALASVIHADLQRLLRNHQQWDRTARMLADDAQAAAERLARGHLVNAGHMEQVREIIQTLGKDQDEQIGFIIDRVLNDWQEQRRAWITAPDADLATLQQANHELGRTAATAMQRLLTVHRTLIEQLDKARTDLDEQVFGVLARHVDRIEALDDTAMRQNGITAAAMYLDKLSAIERARPVGDATFIADAATTARGMAQAAAAPPQQDAAAMRRVAEAYKVLEAGHQVHELATALNELLKLERWDRRVPRAATDHPADWRFARQREQPLSDRLSHPALPGEAAPAMRQALAGDAAATVASEMNARLGATRAAEDIEQPLRRVADEVAAVLAMIRPAMAQARLEAAPDQRELPEQLAELAHDMQAAQQAMADLADRAAAADDPDVAAAEAAELAANQQAMQQQMADLADALARQMREHDFMDQEGRQRMRDDAAAAAALRHAHDRARELLEEAGAAIDPQRQARALEQAAQQQADRGEQVDLLARHFDARRRGEPEPTRTELRQLERALGLQQHLDERFDRLELLAEMGRMDGEQLRRRLEEELPQRRPMQRELDRLAEQVLEEVADQLAEVAREQGQIGARFEQVAAQQDEDAAAAVEQARRISREAEQMGREHVPQLEPRARQGGVDARDPLQQAAQRLEEAGGIGPQLDDRPDPRQLQQQLDELADILQQAGDRLDDAVQRGQEAVDAARQRREAAEAELEAARQQRRAPQDNAALRRLEAASAQRHAQAARDEVAQAAAAAQRLAQEARQLQQQADQVARADEPLRAEAAQQQQALAEAADEAARQVDLAAQHRRQLGDDGRAEQLQRVAEALQRLAAEDAQHARQVIEQAPREQVRDIAEQMQQALDRQQQHLADARDPRPDADAPADGPIPPPQAIAQAAQLAESNEAVDQWLARTLHELERAQRQPPPEAADQRIAQAPQAPQAPHAGEPAPPGATDPAPGAPGEPGAPGDAPGQGAQDGAGPAGEPGAPGAEDAGQPGAEPGAPGAEDAGQPGAEPGAPGAEDAGQPGAEPGAPGAEGAGQPGAEPGAPGAEGAGQPGAEPGAPGAEGAGQPGAEPGAPGAEGAGQPGAEPGATGAEGAGQPGGEPGAPGAEGAGQPGGEPGAPGAEGAGQPGGEPGAPGAEGAGQPGGEPGAPGAEGAGQPGGQPDGQPAPPSPGAEALAAGAAAVMQEAMQAHAQAMLDHLGEAAASALQEAMRAQAQAMQGEPGQGAGDGEGEGAGVGGEQGGAPLTQGDSAGGGSAAFADDLPYELDEHARRPQANGRAWDELTPRQHQELRRGRDDRVSSEYREQVELFRRAVAERARRQQAAQQGDDD